MFYSILMSYEPMYRKWVEKETKKNKAMRLSETDDLYEVYRGMPILREKLNDNPPEYRFRAPRIRARTIEKLHNKIDKKLDQTVPSQRKQDTEKSYRQKWENSQIELSDLKIREAKMLSEFEAVQKKVEKMRTQVSKLEKESVSLKNQLKEAKSKIDKIPKK
jgi:chromosome segregation ATPase